MSIFICDWCGCVENTALCRVWVTGKRICSECDPKIKKWHGAFSKSKPGKTDNFCPVCKFSHNPGKKNCYEDLLK